jgi:hypothetical protein
MGDTVRANCPITDGTWLAVFGPDHYHQVSIPLTASFRQPQSSWERSLSTVREEWEEQVTRTVRLIVCVLVVTACDVSTPRAQGKTYPSLDRYMMPREPEAALARSAAPPNVSSKATIKILTQNGYQVAQQGSNGFVCMVMRGWAAPTYTPAPLRDLVYDPELRAPICFDAVATQTVMPYYELRSKLAMQGKTPDQIAAGVEAAYARGELPTRDGVSYAYMWSADQNLGPAGHWHPHMMVFSPHYKNATLGDNEFGSPLPFVTDDAGTPFAVVVIPVDDRFAIKAAAK